ncbi:MAG: protein kinase [Gammaproteobacteria bacterium]|nr:protein kinase [Gammaproteobacteria bacterium]
MKLGLGQRIFLAFGGLLVLVLGLAAGVTYYRGNRIAGQAVVEALENIRAVQSGYESQRFRQLRLISEIFASDPYFSSYVAEATGGDLGLGGGVDKTSIADLLSERQEDLGFDFAMVLDNAGKVIARTDFPGLSMDDLAGDAVVGPVVQSLESAAGYWFRDDGAYQIAVVPLADEENLVGFLLTGLVVGDRFAEEIKDISGSELVFLLNGKDGLQPVAGTLDDRELDALAQQRSSLMAAQQGAPVEIEIAGRHWLASVSPAGSPDSGGLAVALTSLDEALGDFRDITNGLLIATGISILLALPLSLLVSRGVLAPVRRLATAAQAAARGNYQQRFEAGGKDEVAQLTASFDSLLSDLREKSDMQGYMAALAKFLPDMLDTKGSGSARRSIGHQPSAYGPFALLGIDMRRFARQVDKTAPEEVFNLVNANLETIEALVKAHAGRMVGMSGHRVLVVFDGQDGYKRALTVAGSVMSNLVSQGEGIAAAVVQGHAASGRIYVGEESAENLLGLAVYQLDRLLQEAVSGQLFFTKEIHEAIRKEVPDFKPLISQGVVSKNKFYALNAADTNVFQVEGEEATIPGGGVTLASVATQMGDGRPGRRKVKVMPGITLGDRYEIISELGAGGMGVVYKAHDHELNDLVALKMLKISGAEGEKEYLEAMKSEIRLARKITHPAVLRTFDYGELEGVPYISMEYVRGLTLKYLLAQRGRIPYSAGLHIAKQVAAGLQAAHAQGVLHRDIKAENVILEHNGNAKLMDFGIARQVSGPGLGDLEGAVVGTPRYAAPEQLMGKPVDARADIYAAGVLIYQMYTGEFPFKVKRISELAKAKNEEDPIKPSTYWKEIPPALEDLIMRCIARNPDDRLPSAEKLLEGLEQLRA